jgi:hypothetical protein
MFIVFSMALQLSIKVVLQTYGGMLPLQALYLAYF